ncbi:MAG TPA: type II secretion system protein GspG [Planctomycetota bacterium]
MLPPSSCFLSLALSTLACAQDPPPAPAREDGQRRPFLRHVERDDGGQLDVMVATYRKGDAMVTLHGALHIADAEHYAAMQQRFEAFDALLYELIGDTDLRPHPGLELRDDDFLSMMMSGMGKGFQLVQQFDHLDYRRDHFVHADMTAEEFDEALERAGKSLFGDLVTRASGEPDREAETKQRRLDLVAAFRSGRGAHEMRVLGARMMAAPEGQGNEPTVLIEGRNERCLAVLERQLAAGKKKIGIYYGAAHMEHMERRLVRDLGWERVGEEWVMAWDCRASRFPVVEKGLQQKRYRARRDVEALTEAVTAWTKAHPGEVPTWPALRKELPDGKLPGRADGVDPWGRPYELRAKDGTWDVCCLGSDGVAGTDDDQTGESMPAARSGPPGRLLDYQERRRKFEQELAQRQKEFEQEREREKRKHEQELEQLEKEHQQHMKQLEAMRLEAQMELIRVVAEKYQRKHQRLPTPADLAGEGLPKADAWGNAYRITSAASGAIEVRSNGPDGKPGTADDVVRSSQK